VRSLKKLIVPQTLISCISPRKCLIGIATLLLFTPIKSHTSLNNILSVSDFCSVYNFLRRLFKIESASVVSSISFSVIKNSAKNCSFKYFKRGCLHVPTKISNNSCVNVKVIVGFIECAERVQNKLLKTLEEPPTDTLIFVAVNNLTGILPTIISRTEKLVLNNLSENLLSELGYTSDVIKKSNNILYLCEKLTNDKSKFEMVENCLESLQKSSEVIEYSRKFCKSKDDAKEFLFYFGYIFKLLIKQNLGEIKIYSQSLVENFSLMVLAECITALEKANSEIDSNCVLGQVMDKFLFKILEVKYICKNNI